MVSRDGWVVYDDTKNFILDQNDWWIPVGGPPPPRSCSPGKNQTDAQVNSSFNDGGCVPAALRATQDPVRSAFFPDGTNTATAAACCAACLTAADCYAWVYEDDGSGNCWPLSSYSGEVAATARVFGSTGYAPTGS